MEYAKTQQEKYAEKWFKENEFKIISFKPYMSKAKYKLCKDNMNVDFELPEPVDDISQYMECFKKDFEMQKEIIKLKKEVNNHV